MTCEHCGQPVPEENIQRVCAYQFDPDTCDLDHKNSIFCNCCDNCRAQCNAAKIDEENETRLP